jgi:arylsulfatase A-like enzyme
VIARAFLGARAVDEKSNEIIAIPELLDLLAIKGAIVTIDAMGRQRKIAEKVVDKDADYIFGLKGNQGSAKVDSMYHAGWAWTGDSPFRHTKLIASHFGGARNPMAISWPKRIKSDRTPRPRFHHVNDIVPTIYDILGITPPDMVNGQRQDQIDGVSMAFTFADAAAPGRNPSATSRPPVL